jgi:hypothetical protein
MAGKRSLVRGGITLAVLAALAAAMVVAPAGAHVTGKFGHLKKHIKRIAKKQATQVFNQKIGPATANLQTACSDGSVSAYAVINLDTVVSSDTSFATTGVGPQFNCAGGPIEARYNPTAVEIQVRIPGITTGAGGSGGVVATMNMVNLDCDIGFAVCNGAGGFMATYGTDPALDHLSVDLVDSDGAQYERGVNDCPGFFFGVQCGLAIQVANT